MSSLLFLIKHMGFAGTINNADHIGEAGSELIQSWLVRISAKYNWPHR